MAKPLAPPKGKLDDQAKLEEWRLEVTQAVSFLFLVYGIYCVLRRVSGTSPDLEVFKAFALRPMDIRALMVSPYAVPILQYSLVGALLGCNLVRYYLAAWLVELDHLSLNHLGRPARLAEELCRYLAVLALYALVWQMGQKEVKQPYPAILLVSIPVIFFLWDSVTILSAPGPLRHRMRRRSRSRRWAVEDLGILLGLLLWFIVVAPYARTIKPDIMLMGLLVPLVALPPTAVAVVEVVAEWRAQKDMVGANLRLLVFLVLAVVVSILVRHCVAG